METTQTNDSLIYFKNILIFNHFDKCENVSSLVTHPLESRIRQMIRANDCFISRVSETFRLSLWPIGGYIEICIAGFLEYTMLILPVEGKDSLTVHVPLASHQLMRDIL